MDNKRVLIGMSGGVDSSVSALILKQNGYDVIGITMKLFGGEIEGSCCNISSTMDAKRVCDYLEIPHYTLNFQDDKEIVSSYVDSRIITKAILDYFDETDFVARIYEKQKYRLFGYVGRKDYSIDGLFECYKKLPLSKEKLCEYGMRLLSVSNSANEPWEIRQKRKSSLSLFRPAPSAMLEGIDTAALLI